MSQHNRRRTDPEDSLAHTHRRQTDANAVLHLHSRVNDCEESIAQLLESNRLMSETLRQLTENLGRVAEVLEAWNSAKGFWLTVKFLSAFARVMLPLLAVGGALWIFMKTGTWSSKP